MRATGVWYKRNMNRASPLPWLALTMGDPSGIGPEVLAAAWSDPTLHQMARLLVIGRPEVMRRAVQLRQLAIPVVSCVDLVDAQRLASGAGCMPVLIVGDPEADTVEPANVSAAGGRAAYEAVCRAVELALAKRIGGLVTAPLSKAALHRAGLPFPGHTELLGSLCGVSDVGMLLYLPSGERVRGVAGLGVVHVTLHTSLRSVFELLSVDAIVSKIKLIDEVFRQLFRVRAIARAPRLAVAALNPHGGEGGLFGDEEARLIEPAVQLGQGLGIDVHGPYPVDTLMIRAADGEFDGVVAMYHDQGHIALKLLDWFRAVNVTLGLPIVRTSVAHGTAPDRAWQGTADPRGVRSAIAVAAELAAARGMIPSGA